MRPRAVPRRWPGRIVERPCTHQRGDRREDRASSDQRQPNPKTCQADPRCPWLFGICISIGCFISKSPIQPEPPSSAGTGRRVNAEPFLIVAGSRNIPLAEGEHFIGRDPASTVWLDVPGVSRRHARIVIDRDAASIEDLQSKNGTTLREQLVTGTSALHDSDRIQVGPVLVVFHASASGRSTPDPHSRQTKFFASSGSPWPV